MLIYINQASQYSIVKIHAAGQIHTSLLFIPFIPNKFPDIILKAVTLNFLTRKKIFMAKDFAVHSIITI